ncbi:hypothetical protein [Superficieibacter sp. HKU1]|uniref:hypothetical protein n=1 Tax=Superficieibacter sp. HKU1 TaxID=3031919 RepID=UPI0023E2A082|nr:hypothetical protein [Superficieibacter sp. HKU1]WES67726.1 hypothetical protein P0H77_19280 [Superficieibacter sp. HKU1]
MSRRRPTPQELYYQAIEKQQERERYNQFLQDNGYENTPHNAHLYANGRGYVGMKARDTIEMLAGSLPYMYD